MSDNFSVMPFQISGSTLELKINYQVNSGKEKKKLNLPLKFSITDNKINTANVPTVADVAAQIDSFILRRFLPLLGKNVQVTGMIIKNAAYSVQIPLYLFGLGDTNSLPPDTALFFLLQPYTKLTSYRLYLKGCSSTFGQRPLSEENLKLIQDFELLFTSSLAFLNGLVNLKIIRTTDQLISATFREVKKFSPRKKTKKKTKSVRRKKPLVRKKKVSLIA